MKDHYNTYILPYLYEMYMIFQKLYMHMIAKYNDLPHYPKLTLINPASFEVFFLVQELS